MNKPSKDQIRDHYHVLNSYCSEHSCDLIAVSKRQSDEHILSLYDLGHRAFGENRVEEFLAKKARMPDDMEWHFIGHIQSKKATRLIGHTTLIHSLDRFKLARILNQGAELKDATIKVLFQIKIGQEDSKYGYDFDELLGHLHTHALQSLSQLEYCGVMGMATFTSDEKQIREEFRELKQCFNKIRDQFFKDNDSFHHISMGMSSDYAIAIEEGSNMIRVGSSLFGPRTY